MSALRLLAAAAAFALAGHAQAADQPTGFAGSCAESFVLNKIQDRFAWAERRTWRRGFVMEALQNARPNPHPYAEPGLIERDYCVADAIMTNGDIRTVYYAVERGVGFAGIGRYVDFCVLGLDPWHVHDGACRAVR